MEYEHSEHPPAFTAQEVAAAEHVPGKELAKTVMLTDGKAFVMAVLPATRRIEIDKLREVAGIPDLRLAEEDEFAGLFPNVETGAMAPFGNLYDVPVFVDQTLREDESITFNAGTHTDTIRMAYADFERLVEPVVAEFAG
ncbi:MAG: aminoacyl-tRNA deacylase [Gemmatimonadota bacterium]